MFFHVGTEWLQTFLILKDEREKKGSRLISFWVYPHALYFSMELFTKSLAAHKNLKFDAKKEGLGHSVTKIISFYENKISVFAEIAQNKRLFELIREYENTLDTRFGETAVQMDRFDTDLMLETVYKLKKEICNQTGLE